MTNGTEHHHHHGHDDLFGAAFVDFDEFDSDFFTSGFDTATSDNDNDVRSFDPMLSLPEDIYCSIVDNLEHACWEVNPLELWSYNRTEISQLTRDEIVRIFNTRLIR